MNTETYSCNCSASAGAPAHSRGCPEYQDVYAATAALILATTETVELPSQPVQDPTIHIPADLHDSYEIGFDCDLRVTVEALRKLISSHDAHEAEAYALQDQVDEANSSVTALEQRVAELEGQLRGVLESGDWFSSALEFHNGDGFERQAGITATLAAK